MRAKYVIPLKFDLNKIQEILKNVRDTSSWTACILPRIVERSTHSEIMWIKYLKNFYSLYYTHSNHLTNLWRFYVHLSNMKKYEYIKGLRGMIKVLSRITDDLNPLFAYFVANTWIELLNDIEKREERGTEADPNDSADVGQ